MPSQSETGSDFISIVVADTTRIHTQLLADAISGDPGLQVVASAPSSQELLTAVVRVPVDVAVISYSLDDRPGQGLEALRQMRSLRPEIKGVILLESSRSQDILECFRSGAKGIFSKHERVESLRKCIRCVHDGQIWARSVELDLALEALATSPVVRATDHKGLELLSTREREVVQYLAAGMTNREIADALGLSRHTIKNYLFRIFDKVGVSSRTELLYLTMNSPRPGAADHGDAESFSAILKEAEAGLPWAQLRVAEHYWHNNNNHPDPVTAYMWFLVCQRTMTAVEEQLELSKRNLAVTLSPHQLAEAERRAAEWLNDGKKKPGFVAEPHEKKVTPAGATEVPPRRRASESLALVK